MPLACTSGRVRSSQSLFAEIARLITQGNSMHRLNPKQIETLPAGQHSDGNNLYLVVKDSGARAFMMRYYWQGRPDKMGLGAFDKDVNSLKDARAKALDANRLLAKGINPK